MITFCKWKNTRVIEILQNSLQQLNDIYFFDLYGKVEYGFDSVFLFDLWTIPDFKPTKMQKKNCLMGYNNSSKDVREAPELVIINESYLCFNGIK